MFISEDLNSLIIEILLMLLSLGMGNNFICTVFSSYCFAFRDGAIFYFSF
jgi:hypothetical protein